MAALDEALEVLLRCPVCSARLTRADATVRCAEGHAFDVARQGYLGLVAGGDAGHRGDTAEMVAARERFLGGGFFGPLVAALTEAASGGAGASPAGPVVDLGAGTGWYLARVLDGLPDAVGLGLDVSKPALRRAARAHPRAAAVGCDAWGALPLRDGVAGTVLNVFAPRNGPEIARVLRPGGAALVVTPGAGHLAALVEPLGLLRVDDRKEERLTAALEPHLRMVERRVMEWPLRLGHRAVRDLVAMGPSAFHVEPAAVADRVAGLPEPVDVTASVVLTRAVL
jgi:23S rRNA (guanine745-N1)-methyltransferase